MKVKDKIIKHVKIFTDPDTRKFEPIEEFVNDLANDLNEQSEVILKNLQIKNVDKFRILAKSLDTIEVECGVREVSITFENMFICGDIDFNKLVCLTPMELTLLEIIEEN